MPERYEVYAFGAAMNHSWLELKSHRKLVPGCFWIMERTPPLPLPHFLPLRLVFTKMRKGIQKPSE